MYESESNAMILFCCDPSDLLASTIADCLAIAATAHSSAIFGGILFREASFDSPGSLCAILPIQEPGLKAALDTLPTHPHLPMFNSC